MKISGYVCIRNNRILDYCVSEAVRSLIPVCDEVVISVAESDDDTRDTAESLAREDSRVRVIEYPWDNPVRRITFWTDWLNHTRERLLHPMQLTLDADEVLCPSSYDTIRKAAEAGECRWVHRLNFWGDTRHLAPHGRVCGEQVVRLAPTSMWMCSDEPHPEGEAEIRLKAGWPPCATPEMRIFHYGFLRRNSAFFAKVRVVNGAFFGSYDDRLQRAEDEGVHWSTYCDFDIPILEHLERDHPPVAHQWLRDRGFEP